MLREKFLGKETLHLFRILGRQEYTKNPIVVCKFICDVLDRERYATELYEDSEEFFGYVVGFESEWGYFSVKEFEDYIICGQWRKDPEFRPCRRKELGL